MRLTCKIEKNYQTHYDIKEKYVDNPNPFSIWVESCEALKKLGQLEDIEEDLGIDLITLFKALTRGIYHREYPSGEIKYISTPALWLKNVCYNEWLECYWVIEHHGLKSYGKDWALTKEELL